MMKSFQILFISLLVVFSFQFFEARFLSKFFVLYLPFLYVSFAIAISIPFFFTQRQGFVLPVQLIVLSMLVSIFIAHMSWGQGYQNSIFGTVPMMLWIFFFYLLQKEIPGHIIEKIILIYGVIYCILFFYQLIHSQTVLFGRADEFNEERGTIRISIAGQGALFLASFIALNKLTSQKKGRLAWILLTLSGLVIPIIQATRQFIIAVFLIFLYHFIKDLSFFRKMITIAFLIGLLFLYILKSNNPIVKGLLEIQQETSQEGKENIRVLSGTYFLTELSPNNINKFVGNGVPFGDNSFYNKFIESLKLRGYYMSDIGIISVYAMFGIIGVLGYILIWIRSFTIPLNKDYYYLKYYLWFLLITSLTSDTAYSKDFLICTVFVLYLYQSQYIDQMNLNSISIE